ncbi:MAG: hypothetical protein IPK52_11790 [Chloroflexi bacterium]|nr:hypothetical protein [Chloroflexota bacterium]
MQISGNPFDRTVERVLRVKPVERSESQERSAENTFMFSMLFTGIRCVLEYILLPFALPLLNLSNSIAIPVVLAANAVALSALVYSVRKFWMIDYEYKRAYLGVGVVGGIILVLFLIGNLRAMLG